MQVIRRLAREGESWHKGYVGTWVYYGVLEKVRELITLGGREGAEEPVTQGREIWDRNMRQCWLGQPAETIFWETEAPFSTLPWRKYVVAVRQEAAGRMRWWVSSQQMRHGQGRGTAGLRQGHSGT